MSKLPKTYDGKSTKLGHGGRAAKLHDELKSKNPSMPEKEIGAIIGKNARKKQAAPGQKYYSPTQSKHRS